MTLKEMSAEYRAAAQPLRERLRQLRQAKSARATARSCSGSTGG